ncbi:carbohydrate ABC transporter permease [Mycoplasma marinum]|uniref:ABC transmembrane type-1 domain-containing protein n=1 Tax=Mycoplasma marinum TaxID=1937190 RepID=A0A4R0XM03_9MOLU|nr:sugar ABC transporter permease [Mycoplasma marinum]TCG11544.1 hypothetical protein C4B24_01705 [Mycoplasma marinum]
MLSDRKLIRNALKERVLIAEGATNSQIRRIKRKEALTASVFVATPIVIISIYVFLAFILAIILSFFSGNLDPSMKSIHYVGFGNWTKVFKDPMLGKAVKNTFLFASVTTAFNIVGALIITSILNLGKIKNKNFFLTIYFFPQVTSSIAAAIIFTKIIGKDGLFHLDLIKNPSDAMWIMIVSSIWGGISGGMITFNTAFSGIGNSQYEAAKVDGASAWQSFISITVPSLGPILAYTLITSVIGGMGVFDQAYVMALIGGNGRSVMTWSLLGFARIIPVKGAGMIPNVGLGVATLTFLGITIFGLTKIINIFKPIDRK